MEVGEANMKSTRREVIQFASIAALLRPASAWAAGSKTVRIAEFDATGKLVKVAEVERVEKSPEEWRKQLKDFEFQVARKSGTERAFTGRYHDHHADGIYRCVCCQTALFDSRTKFDSGTGWPSFYATLAKENVKDVTDSTLGMRRVENRCARCDAHLGHVFEDGPKPTGLRYCMNSASLDFVARAKKSST